MNEFKRILESDYHVILEDNRHGESIVLATEKYAKQQMKEFAEWINSNSWIQEPFEGIEGIKKWHYYGDDEVDFDNGKSTEQLIEIFLNK